MEKKISTIKNYRSNFVVFFEDRSWVSLYCERFRDEDDRPCTESDARETLAEMYDITGENADKIINDMYTFYWIVGDDEVYLYRIDTYQAYRADEQGIRWMTKCPHDTAYYKHEILDGDFFHLPSGFGYDKDNDIFYKDDIDYELVNENDGSVSLVSCNEIVHWFKK